MKQQAIRFVVAFALLCALIQAQQPRVVNALYDFPHLLMLTREYGGGAPSPAAVLYLGDSVLQQVGKADRDRRELPRMVQDRLEPGVRLVSASFPTWTFEMFALFVRVLEQLPARPRQLLIPVNIRSLSDVWFRNPRFDLSDHRLYLSTYGGGFVARKALHSFLYDRPQMSLPAHRALPVMLGTERIGDIGEYARQSIQLPAAGQQNADIERLMYATQYGHPVAADHPRLRALAGLIAATRALGIRPVVYATPVNKGRASRACGPEITRQIEARIRLVQAVCTQAGVPLRELSGAVAEGHFTDYLEHLDEVGRGQVADHLARALKEP